MPVSLSGTNVIQYLSYEMIIESSIITFLNGCTKSLSLSVFSDMQVFSQYNDSTKVIQVYLFASSYERWRHGHLKPLYIRIDRLFALGDDFCIKIV